MKWRFSLKYSVSLLAALASCAIAGQAVAADAAPVGNVQNARDKVSMCICLLYTSREISIDRDLLAPSGHLDMLIGHECSICSEWFFCTRAASAGVWSAGRAALAKRTLDSG